MQIHERLRDRTDITLFTLAAADRKDARRRVEAINACDIANLCLPDAAAREAGDAITNPAVGVIDASSNHRTRLGWTYGFPEMTQGQAERIASARRVTNPGCYPTGAIGLLRPFWRLGPTRQLPHQHSCDVGLLRRGRAGVDEHEGQIAGHAPSFQVFGLGLAHKHTPEIQKHAGLVQRPIFVPAYGSFRQRIVLTVPLELRLLAPDADGATLYGCLARHYAPATHVRVLPPHEAGVLRYLDPQAPNVQTTCT